MNPVILVFLLNLFFASLSFAEPCKVSGISDSPQFVSCTYHNGWYEKLVLEISCVQGKYEFKEFIANHMEVDSGPIVTTFHEEVSKGPSPLNFQFENGRVLRITKKLLRHRGEFMMDRESTDHFRCSVK